MSITEVLGLKKRNHVGLAVSANNTLELICIDKGIKSVSKYASGEVQYNSAMRELIDYDEFSQTVINLFDEAGLNPQECCVSLSLPNVHFGINMMENNSDQAYVIDNLQSELEDLYIFKRNDPVLSYDYVPSTISKSSKNIAYSAIQSKVVMKFIEVFDKLGIEVERIDNSYVTLLRGLRFCDKFNTVLAPEIKTAVLIISANSFCSMVVSGDAISECKEAPLAVKSYSSEEVYSIVSKYTMDAVEQNSPQALIIISETDDINAQLLTEKIEFSGDIEYVNKSAASDEELLDYNKMEIDPESGMISFLSLEAIGAGISSSDDYLSSINFLPQERINKNIIEIGGYEVELIRFFIEVLLIAAIIAGIIGLLILGYLKWRIKQQEDINVANSKEIKLKEEAIKQKSKNTSQKEIAPIIQQTLNNNEFIFNTYSGLSTEIPSNMYIKQFVSDYNGAMAITGESRTSEAVESFVNKLKDKNTTLMVSRLSVNSTSDQFCKIPNGFSFTIKSANADIDLDTNNPQVKGALNGMTNDMNTILPQSSNPVPPIVSQTSTPTPVPVNTVPGGNGSLTPPPPPVI